MYGTINIKFPLARTFIPMLNSRRSVNVTTSYPLTSKFGSHEVLPLCLCYILFTDSSTMLNINRCYGHPKAKYTVNIKLSLCTPSRYLVEWTYRFFQSWRRSKMEVISFTPQPLYPPQKRTVLRLKAGLYSYFLHRPLFSLQPTSLLR